MYDSLKLNAREIMFGNKAYLILLIFCCSASFSYSQAVSRAVTLLELKEICQGLEFQFAAHPTNQQKYVICVPGGGVEIECDANHCFDERNPPCSTNCNTNTNAADQTVKDYCNAENTTLLDRVANDKDCELYYLCVGKNVDPLSQKCPPNQHYSEEHKICLNYYEANCVASSKWCKKRRDGTRFPHSKCYQYYECENGTTVSKLCSYGEYFNRALDKCVSGICQQDQRTPNCQGQIDGSRMAHAKCYKYFVCLNQSLFEAQCANGYHFDKNIVSCVRDINNVCNDN